MSSETLILLPAFNGIRYIRQQIASIQAQTISHWRLWVADDCSNDGTSELVKQLSQDDARISLRCNSRRLGLRANINVMMVAALQDGARYCFLADQDDVWRCDKMALQLEAMRHEESLSGRQTAILIHSDLLVINENSAVRAASFWRALRVFPERPGTREALPANNLASGNSMLLNRALLEYAVPVPDDAIMHDWWLALLAAASGQIHFIGQPLVRYRRHGANVVGPRSFFDALAALPSDILLGKSGWQQDFRSTLIQAAAVVARLQGKPMHSGWRNKLACYARLESMSRLDRLRSLSDCRIAPLDPARRLVFWLKVLGLPRTGPGD